jgi:hypothetical protein
LCQRHRDPAAASGRERGDDAIAHRERVGDKAGKKRSATKPTSRQKR